MSVVFLSFTLSLSFPSFQKVCLRPTFPPDRLPHTADGVELFRVGAHFTLEMERKKTPKLRK